MLIITAEEALSNEQLDVINKYFKRKLGDNFLLIPHGFTVDKFIPDSLGAVKVGDTLYSTIEGEVVVFDVDLEVEYAISTLNAAGASNSYMLDGKYYSDSPERHLFNLGEKDVQSR